MVVEGCDEVFAEGRGGIRFVVNMEDEEDDAEEDDDVTRSGGCFSCLLGFLYIPPLPPPAPELLA